MSPEPNKKMEELLKRHAAQRKAQSGAEFELHPVTRKLLQGEVSRTFSPSAAKTKPSFLFALWPRLAFVGIFTALLATTVLVLNTPQKNKPAFELSQRSDQAAVLAGRSESAKDEKAASTRDADQSGLAKMKAPATAPAPVRNSRKTEAAPRSGTGMAEANRQRKQVSEPLAPVVSENKPRTLADEKIGQSIPASKSLDSPAATTNIAAADSLSLAAAVTSNHLSADGISPRRKFVQQDSRAKYRRNLLSPAPPKILQSFEVVQNGKVIQFVDSDGSIYTGEILNPPNEVSSDKELNGKISSPSPIAFRVSGTNQQNQRVTFTGELDSPIASFGLGGNAPAKSDGFSTAGGFKKSDVPSIRGKVSIGGTNEFEIQATEVAK